MKFYIHKKIEEIILHEVKLPEKIDEIVDGIEVVITEPFFADLALSDSSLMKKIDDFCNSKERSVHLPFYDLNLASSDRHIAEYSFNAMLQGIEFAENIEASIAVAHLGYNILTSISSTDKWFAKFIDKKEKLENAALKKGITIVWENTYELDFLLFDRMIEIQPDTKFCLDAGHCNCFAHFSAIEFLERYKSSTVHLHLHDNFGDEDSHLAPGKGNIDFNTIMKKAENSGVKTAAFEVDFEKFTESIDNIRKIFY